MREGLRQHSCSFGIDYQRKIIFCGPEDGNDFIVLTTPVLYAWYCHQVTTSEGMANMGFVKVAGHVGKDLVLTLAEGFKIVFCKGEKISLYGMILTQNEGDSIFGFANDCATRKVGGSPYLFRKNVFISHSSEDKPTVREIGEALSPSSNIWIDENNIKLGDSISAAIDDGLENCDAILLCFSSNISDSRWIRREYGYAMHKGIPILPVRLDGCSPPPTLQDTKYIDYPGASSEKAIDSIMAAIEAA